MFDTGSVIQLKGSRCTKELIVENLGGRLLLAELSNPYSRLHFTGAGVKKDSCEVLSGSVEFKSGSPHSSNLVEIVGGGRGKYAIVLCSKSNRGENKHSERLCTLNIDKDGAYAWISIEPQALKEHEVCNYLFEVAVKSGNIFRKLDHSFKFQQWQIRRLTTEGYLHLPRVCNASRVARCVATLNNALGVPGRVVAGGVQGEGLGKLAGDLSNCEAVKALFSGEVEAVVDALFAGSGADKTNLSAQIAFRFPEVRLQKEHPIVSNAEERRQMAHFGNVFAHQQQNDICCCPFAHEVFLFQGSHCFL